MSDETIPFKKTKVQQTEEKWKLLIDEAEIDCEAVSVKNINKILGTTSLVCKWMRYKTEWESIYELYEMKRKKRFNDLWKFYKVESNLKINTKEELFNFIETDVSYSELYLVSNTIARAIDYIDVIIDALKAKNFEISRFIDWYKFQHGK